ncbi:MAG: acyl-CoA synthetase [Alphaproteobacteria bacterium]|nr:acyl-CoA synthetase [Alphaproteobacteria bacterium]
MNTNSLFAINNNTILFCGSQGNKTIGQFATDIGRFANYFAKINTDTVILYIPDNFYLFCVCFFALLQLHKAVALPGILTPQNANLYADLTQVIITDSANDFCGFTKVSPNASSDTVNWNFTDMSDAKVYFFTSGSTGVPKRIEKTMSMLFAEVDYHIRMHANLIDQKPIVVASIAAYHMYGVLWRVLFPMLSGIPVDTDMVFTPEELIEKQSRCDKVIFMTTPSFLDGITRYGGQYNFPRNCIGIFTSGSLLSAKTANATFDMFGVSPFEIFGSTETGGVACRQQKIDVNWTIFDTVKLDIKDGCAEVVSPYSFQNPYVMSDAIDPIDARHFRLLGRADRIVKIAEERISLPDMEKWLENNEYVSRAYCVVMRKGVRDIIGCMMELTDTGAARIVSIGRREFIEELKRYLSGFIPKVALPRCIRIVNQIPTNSQGKFIKNEILAMLNSPVFEPIVQNLVRTNTNLTANLTFLGDSAYFEGHFPNLPILPGVIQMHFVFRFIRQFFHTTVPAFDVVKLKYSSLILPNVLTHFELIQLSENEFTFCYSQEGKVCSGGKIIIREQYNV